MNLLFQGQHDRCGVRACVVLWGRPQEGIGVDEGLGLVWLGDE